MTASRPADRLLADRFTTYLTPGQLDRSTSQLLDIPNHNHVMELGACTCNQQCPANCVAGSTVVQRISQRKQLWFAACAYKQHCAAPGASVSMSSDVTKSAARAYNQECAPPWAQVSMSCDVTKSAACAYNQHCAAPWATVSIALMTRSL